MADQVPQPASGRNPRGCLSVARVSFPWRVRNPRVRSFWALLEIAILITLIPGCREDPPQA
jgi:hypothetical protein